MLGNLDNRSRSILQEISSYVPAKNKEQIVEARAEHIISSAINLLDLINENFTDEEAEQLEKRFLSSIRGRDAKRFVRGIRKIKESNNK